MSVTNSGCGARAATGRCWRRQPQPPPTAPARLPGPDGARAHGRRDGYLPAIAGSRCVPARPRRLVAVAVRWTTPRYAAIPRWGLHDSIESTAPGRAGSRRQAPSADRVRTTFFVAAVALGAAALVHVVRYLLLIINRSTLLNWLVADAAALLSVLASLAAVAR